ncbi:probable inactive receptor kinase At2g26730 [Selaginella moellendorffii]|uniref:probable inactive receptor kinase At2g26730 n=1 Tax=Selaginella moellendorffii TaxID=88036 RepID=UPI000D1C2651|nr:probable inactive receptor kinase At2g26730 [Selaginella moellendorffii]|eukprot:XP_024521350.1 probable inactive receptor kinase At2g26730 [Selaginella moellendorffii]
MRKKKEEVEVVVVLLLVAAVVASLGDLSQDRDALLDFYNAVGSASSNRRLGWNRSAGAGPCDWRGIECSSTGITRIRLPGVGLAGSVPPGSLSSLTSLRVLSLRSNRLGGPFPDLRNCSQLRALYLQDNRFSGRLPPDFSLWPQLLHINLAYNALNGSIPTSINSLTRLTTLNLENNTLSGGLAPELSLPRLVRFSVANNNLSGPVPQRLQGFSSAAFDGNVLICGPPLSNNPCPITAAPPAITPGIPPPGRRRRSRGLSSGAIAGIVLGSIAAAVVAALLCCLLVARSRRQRRATGGGNRHVTVRARAQSSFKPSAGAVAAGGSGGDHAGDSTSKEEDLSSSLQGDQLVGSKLVFLDPARRGSFDLEDLLRASAEVLGKGSIGTTYKAVLEDGSIVAVKRLKDVTAPPSQFEHNMQLIGGLRHRNVVPLRAYYHSKDEKLLVSDYMPRGSCSALLHGNRGAGRSPLDWPSRLRIADGAAKGLAYIHEQNGGTFVHGSIKSSNVLLAKDFEACVSDAGLAHLLTTNAAATSSRMLGYRAPEVLETRKVTQKSDVYSYGVLLLELLTGRAPTQASLTDEGIDLPRWVQSVVREEWTAEVFDLELMRYHNIEEDLVQMLQLALSCTSVAPEQRPSMRQVVETIEQLRRASSSDGGGGGGGSGSGTGEDTS